MRWNVHCGIVLLLLFNLSFALAADPVVVVAPGQIAGAQQPRVAVDERGTIFVTFGASEDIYICKSEDAGQSFSAPAKIGRVDKLALGMRRGPRIVSTAGVVVVSAIGHESGDLVMWRSDDHGETWSDAVRVNDEARSAREGLHAMAAGPDGLLFCCWLDLRAGSTRIYAARSWDGGKTWTENQEIYASPSGTVCECCHLWLGYLVGAPNSCC